MDSEWMMDCDGRYGLLQDFSLQFYDSEIDVDQYVCFICS